ncbi:hypothetical protein [Streptomyces sp. NPDC059175]|uniref:hypothetical protein n=1 Tax=unclassified Streptomyces TaxID=2593676 RepID=UPI003683C973
MYVDERSTSTGGHVVRMRRAVIAVLALVAVAGCSSAEDQQRLTGLRANYCLQLGTWQKARNAAGTTTPESPADENVEAAAQDAFLAMRPLREEGVRGGRTLGEETVMAITGADATAESRVVHYCDDAGFETLTR